MLCGASLAHTIMSMRSVSATKKRNATTKSATNSGKQWSLVFSRAGCSPCTPRTRSERSTAEGPRHIPPRRYRSVGATPTHKHAWHPQHATLTAFVTTSAISTSGSPHAHEQQFNQFVICNNGFCSTASTISDTRLKRRGPSRRVAGPDGCARPVSKTRILLPTAWEAAGEEGTVGMPGGQ